MKLIIIIIILADINTKKRAKVPTEKRIMNRQNKSSVRKKNGEFFCII